MQFVVFVGVYRRGEEAARVAPQVEHHAAQVRVRHVRQRARRAGTRASRTARRCTTLRRTSTRGRRPLLLRERVERFGALQEQALELQVLVGAAHFLRGALREPAQLHVTILY